jgi:hypothetical protein
VSHPQRRIAGPASLASACECQILAQVEGLYLWWTGIGSALVLHDWFVNFFYQGRVLNIEGVLQKAGDFLLWSFRCLLENSRSYVDYPVQYMECLAIQNIAGGFDLLTGTGNIAFMLVTLDAYGWNTKVCF